MTFFLSFFYFASFLFFIFQIISHNNIIIKILKEMVVSVLIIIIISILYIYIYIYVSINDFHNLFFKIRYKLKMLILICNFNTLKFFLKVKSI
jgi:hypothetical protein